MSPEANRMASPLHWPIGRPRTAPHLRRRNLKWKATTVAAASDEIVREVRLMGGSDLVLSTNLALRADGFPRSGQPEPADPGAGHSPDAIVDALAEKQARNEARKWPDWRKAVPGQPIEHVREEPGQ